MNIKNICVGIGVFDGVHIGHAQLLKSLADYAEKNNSYPLAITFSPHPRALTVPEHAPKLLVPLNQRIDLLKQNGAIDVFVIDFNRDFANLESEEFLRMFCLNNAVKIDCICVGKNWRFGKNGVMVARFQGWAAINGLAEAVKHAPEEFLTHRDGKYLASRDDFSSRGNTLAAPKRGEQGHVFNKAHHFGLEAEIFPRVL